jgi:DNA-binding transcriptional ArsR family regulator
LITIEPILTNWVDGCQTIGVATEPETPEERSLPQPAVEELQLDRVMQALSDRVRLQVLSVLADGAFHPCRLEEFDVGVHKSTLSHHFRVLRETGVVTTRLDRDDARNHHVRLRREAMDVRFPGLLDAVLGAARGSASGR